LTEFSIHTLKIKQIIEECEGVKTFIFNIKDNNLEKYVSPKPGQFVMIWVPGVDEIPMSISGCDNETNWSITVKNVGECTAAIHKLNVNDFIGVRGPLGNQFRIPENNSKRIILVSGGIGTAPLKFLAQELNKKNFQFFLVEGAKVSIELMFKEDFERFNQKDVKVFYCTEDGSFGEKGLSTETFEKIIEKSSKQELANTIVYACGPEKMIYEIFKICERYNIELQASLERIMRCGCGLCGLCAMDPLGLLVCKDGPVFSLKELKQLEDFGKYKRDFTGKKIPLD